MPAINADIFRVFRVFIAYEDVARVHIGMEKAVAKDLSEEHLHAAFRQQFHVGAVFLQRRNIRHRNAVNALHHHHPFTTVMRW